MNQLQKFRFQMAQLGFEYTIDETKDLVKIAKKLVKLSRLSEEELRLRCDFDNHSHVALYNAVMEIKRKRAR